eukprot:TRINITY_DN67817_c0_g1_i1.p1 TRINITY_DN67817_c0_g1~~TRINITY_DN67817_c0_g1_i1.p1  ORF type:complete len:899 (+),score=197.02 TRINITY_DN67817_c0_g1_i1:64-2760(+)
MAAVAVGGASTTSGLGTGNVGFSGGGLGSAGQADWLTPRQATLLDELAVVAAQGGDTSAKSLCENVAVEGMDVEGFHDYWRQINARHRFLEEKQRRCRWEWIEQMQGICASTCGELSTMLGHLTELDDQRQEVTRMTTALHERCEQMVHDQAELGSTAEQIAERLDLFDRVADVARILDQGNAATSHPDFPAVLDQLDGSIGFLEAHDDFCQAQAYLHQFEHLRNKACLAIRSAVQKSLEKSVAQVEGQLRDKARDGAVETQVFYTRFKAAALNYQPLMQLLRKRVDVHETYTVTLEELEVFYVHLRTRLISSPVTAHLQTILHRELEMSQLAPATRQASTYILDISHFERQCFEAYFEPRQQQEALRLLLETVADIFYKTLRPVVLSCGSTDSLREMADCLQMDILEPYQQSSRPDLVPVLTVVFRLHKDVQEKLIFRVQTFIREDIRDYQVRDVDLNYPSVLFSNDPGAVIDAEESALPPSAAEAALQRGWFPTMQRTVGILAKIYRVLEMSTFQGLAQEAVDICVGSLRNVARQLSQRPLPDQNHVVAPLVQMMDAQLFLVKHLLILREQVAAFECDLVASEKYFDFSNVWEALQLKLPDGLLGILKPKMHQSQVDSKKDIEAELKSACETLITNLTAHITQPLASVNTQISEFLSAFPGDRSRLREQSFMAPDRLREVISAFLSNVRQRVPLAAAHIRLYLSSRTGSGSAAAAVASSAIGFSGGPPAVSSGAGGDMKSAATSTSSILFKPVQIRLVDTWNRLEGLLEEQQFDTAELEGLGFIPPSVLRDLVGALFSGIMEAPWPSVVEVVSQVQRTTVAAEPPVETPAAGYIGGGGTAATAAVGGGERDSPATVALPSQTEVPVTRTSEMDVAPMITEKVGEAPVEHYRLDSGE